MSRRATPYELEFLDYQLCFDRSLSFSVRPPAGEKHYLKRKKRPETLSSRGTPEQPSPRTAQELRYWELVRL